ncbi:hypothetical protein MUO79_02945 [Candidatus Bathyarchaeota archaeon]|nr:hypothetical protein [Candidatus Bathyarchaeota archaeon]
MVPLNNRVGRLVGQEILTKKARCWLVLSRNLYKNPFITEIASYIGISMRKSIVLLLVLAFLTASCIVTPVKAESRTIVVPDDYPTIATAIAHAKEGDTIFVKKGTYEEHSLVINKTISLIGEDAHNTIIKDIDPLFISTDFPPINSITVKINSDGIRISGLTLTGGALGVAGNGARNQIIDNIIIAQYGVINLEGSNQTIVQNTIETPFLAPNTTSGYGIRCRGSYNYVAANKIAGASNEGITLGGQSSFNVVYGNTITNAGGVDVYGDGNIIAKNNITSTIIGISGNIRIHGGSNNIVCANRITGDGLIVLGYNNTLYANDADGVGIGGVSSSSADNTFYHNNFAGSAQKVKVWTGTPGPIIWDNGKEGNFWGDYTGTDANGDGIGDTPYLVGALYYDPDIGKEVYVGCGEDNYPLMAPFNISSVDLQLPDWASLPSNPSPEPQTSEPFPTTLVAAASGASVAVVGAGLLIYFKKRKH